MKLKTKAKRRRKNIYTRKKRTVKWRVELRPSAGKVGSLTTAPSCQGYRLLGKIIIFKVLFP